jgi:hypothetical protein
MKLRPIREQRNLEQDAFRCRKVRLTIPYAFTPIEGKHHPHGHDMVYEYMRTLERFNQNHFSQGPPREQVEAPEEIYFNEHAPQVYFLVPYLN